uniref:hypothetical protein n=1 Tax=Escherichia coli TaxID=562 RepID=UPI00197AB41F
GNKEAKNGVLKGVVARSADGVPPLTLRILLERPAETKPHVTCSKGVQPARNGTKPLMLSSGD